MNPLVEMFREGGLVMYPILALAMLLLPASGLIGLLALVSVWRAEVRQVALALAALQLAGAGLLLAMGLGGWFNGRRAVDEAIAYASPEHRETIREAGYAEALQPLKFGGGTALFVAGPAVISLLLAGGRSRAAAGDDPA